MTGLAERLREAFAPEAAIRRVLVFVVGCIVCAALLTRVVALPAPTVAAGEVATSDIRATISFTWVDTATTAERAAAAEAQVLPVFEADLALARRLESRVAHAFELGRAAATPVPTPVDPAAPPVDARAAVSAALEVSLDDRDLEVLTAAGWDRAAEDLVVELLGAGMRRHVIADRASLPPAGRPLTLVSVLGSGRDEAVIDDVSLLRTEEEARQAISLRVVERFQGAADPRLVNAAAAVARALVTPNVRYDEATTLARRAAAREGVGAVQHTIQRGTRIVRAGDVVTPGQAGAVAAMRALDSDVGRASTFAAWAALVGLIVGSIALFAQSTIRKFAGRAREREAMWFALALVLLASRVLSEVGSALDLPPPLDRSALGLLVPVAGGAMLVRTLVNSESALVWALVASVLCSVSFDQGVSLVVYHLVTTFVATRGVGQARERLAAIRAGVQGGLAGGLVTALFAAVQVGAPGGGVGLDVGTAAGSVVVALLAGLLNAVVALGFTPAFELFGFTTDYKLLELASLNHPLLRQLMLRAPGTYHHSVIVGSLSEAACESIGANALLARVACYFHDIGKGLKPQYFIENQREGPNRHDRLSPEASAALIINHVRDGGALARQHRLPRPIVDNIYMHHGTGIIHYFYARAREQAAQDGLDPDAVDDAPFRYPGPKPDTREAGIIMLADKVEAACRTIREPSEERIRAMIQQIVNGVMNDGQLEECPLTLKELYVIADTFTNVIQGIYHHRIEYPSTRDISSGTRAEAGAARTGARLPPIPRQGAITLEILNPLRPSPSADERNPVDEA